MLDGMLSREEVAKRLDRRVSRGEYERVMDAHLRKRFEVAVTSTSRGRHTGERKVVETLSPKSPKSQRKGKDAACEGREEKGKRARYNG